METNPLETPKDDPPRPQNRTSQVLFLASLLLAVLIILSTLTEDWQKIEDFIRGSGWWGALIGVALYGILGATPIPSEPLTILLTAIYGPWLTTLVCSVGNVLAALVEYFVGHQIGDAADFLKQKDRLPLGLGKLPVNSTLFLLGARMLPGYGAKFVSVICGIYRVPLWRYLWTTFLATSLGAALLAYGGFGIIQIWK